MGVREDGAACESENGSTLQKHHRQEFPSSSVLGAIFWYVVQYGVLWYLVLSSSARNSLGSSSSIGTSDTCDTSSTNAANSLSSHASERTNEHEGHLLEPHAALFPNEPAMTLSERDRLRNDTLATFETAFRAYRKFAFPYDELAPVTCKGRGPDRSNPDNIGLNDVLGDYSLTLVDSLDSLAAMGLWKDFDRYVAFVERHLNFAQHVTVQVFESTIRILGALLSAHLIAVDRAFALSQALQTDTNTNASDNGNKTATSGASYRGGLLRLAEDLARRLLPAFDSPTGLPYPRVNLLTGVPAHVKQRTTQCAAGAGSLLLEFGVLSRLVGNVTYEQAAHGALLALWQRRSRQTGLLGSAIDVESGEWTDSMAGLGASSDSFYEYLWKAYVLFGCVQYRQMYDTLLSSAKTWLRFSSPPLWLNVHMHTGQLRNTWVDSLSAFFAGLQVQHGDVAGAERTFAFYFALWRRYDALPERYDWARSRAIIYTYPLRPELAESAFLLHRATGHPAYLRAGATMLRSLQVLARTQCGFATLHSVIDKSHDDRMESFFLSETLKYLFLLFDRAGEGNNPPNVLFARRGAVLTTQAHALWLDAGPGLNQTGDDWVWPCSARDWNWAWGTPRSATGNHEPQCTAMSARSRFERAVHGIGWQSKNDTNTGHHAHGSASIWAGLVPSNMSLMVMRHDSRAYTKDQ